VVHCHYTLLVHLLEGTVQPKSLVFFFLFL